jgi:hypothetical protein
MKILGTAVLALSILAAPVSFAFAKGDAPMTPSVSDVHNSINGDMPRTHDKGAIVQELNNNGIHAQTNQARSANEG